FDVPSGIIYEASDMVDVKCKGDYELRVSIIDTNIPTADVAADKASVYAGDTSGYIHVEISGVGKRSEGGHPVEAYLFVGLNESEQAELINNSNKRCLMIDNYLRSEFFTEKNNTVERRNRFEVIYNTDNSFGDRKEMTEALFSEYVKKLEGAELVGVLGYYDQSVFSENDIPVSNKYLMVYKTEKGEMLHLTVSEYIDRNFSEEKAPDLHVMADAPDSSGLYLYEIEMRNIESADTRNTLSDPRLQSKVGEDINLYVEDVSEELYERWNVYGENMLDRHTLHYVFKLKADN
ncbi:MAG: hypothetical protein J6Z74_02540, partial [Eubacterium sp.]|nr:hypothetical protein [Eubacterium sp.]